jgi:hypothetical protein
LSRYHFEAEHHITVGAGGGDSYNFKYFLSFNKNDPYDKSIKLDSINADLTSLDLAYHNIERWRQNQGPLQVKVVLSRLNPNGFYLAEFRPDRGPHFWHLFDERAGYNSPLWVRIYVTLIIAGGASMFLVGWCFAVGYLLSVYFGVVSVYAASQPQEIDRE